MRPRRAPPGPPEDNTNPFEEHSNSNNPFQPSGRTQRAETTGSSSNPFASFPPASTAVASPTRRPSSPVVRKAHNPFEDAFADLSMESAPEQRPRSKLASGAPPVPAIDLLSDWAGPIAPSSPDPSQAGTTKHTKKGSGVEAKKMGARRPPPPPPPPPSASLPTKALPAQSTSDVVDLATSVSKSEEAHSSIPPELNPEQMAVELRPPPLRPQSSPPLKRLCSCGAALLSWPLSQKSQVALQWVMREGVPQCPVGAVATPQEDPDSSPAAAVLAPPVQPLGLVTSMVADAGRGLLWTGHENGTVCQYWVPDGGLAPAQFMHCWSAHLTGKVRSLALTGWGDLWTCSSSGSIRIWSYGTTARGSSQGSKPPKKMKDLKRQYGAMPHHDARHIVVTSSGKMVWTAGRTSLCLWNAYDGNFFGTIAPPRGAKAEGLFTLYKEEEDDQTNIDPRMGLGDWCRRHPLEMRDREVIASSQDDDLNDSDREGLGGVGGGGGSGYSLLAKKGLGKASNVLKKMGKRVKEKYLEGAGSGGLETGADSDQGDVIVGLATDWQGGVCVAYRKGLVERYEEYGRLSWRSSLFPGGISCIAVFGDQVWLGGGEGGLWVLEGESGRVLRQWKSAHNGRLTALEGAWGLVWSVAKDGAIRGWLPSELPGQVQRSVARGLSACTQMQRVNLLCTTWNVAESEPDRVAIKQWLGGRVASANLVMVALQETEMGTGSVARDAAYSSGLLGFYKSRLEVGNSTAQAWAQEILQVLGPTQWSLMKLRQMAGILVVAYCRKELTPSVGQLMTSSVACGVLGVGGNKGATAIRFSLFRRQFMVISSHFTAHQDNCEQRNADYAKIVKGLQYSASALPQTSVGGDTAALVVDEQRDGDFISTVSDNGELQAVQQQAHMQKTLAMAGSGYGIGVPLPEVDLLVWMGDFNYRIDADYDEVFELIDKGQLRALLAHDQCIREMKRGRVFVGLKEGPINFQPTYKYEPLMAWAPGTATYDRGEKQRIPSWTDRVMFRGSVGERPRGGPVNAELAGSDAYCACAEVVVSDHKPVVCSLVAQVPYLDQAQARRVQMELLAPLLAENSQSSAQAVSLFPQGVHLATGGECATVKVTNTGPCQQYLVVLGVTDTTATRQQCPTVSLPPWLEVSPMRAVIAAGGEMLLKVTPAEDARQSAQCVMELLSSPWPLSMRSAPSKGNHQARRHQVEVSLSH